MTEEVDVVVIGGGLAGLGAARHLTRAGVSHLVLESESEPGGLARSFRIDGFAFDCSGHLLHLRNEELRGEVLAAAPGAWLEIERRSHILLDGALIRYPMQANLVDASQRVRSDCLEGLPTRAEERPPSSFGDWVESNLGIGIAKWFMRPYNEKLYGVPLDDLAPSAIGRFLPRVDLDDIRNGAIEAPLPTGYNAQFLYPAQGGIDLLYRTLLASTQGVRTDARVIGIDTSTRSVQLANGTSIGYRFGVVCSAPLPETLRMAALPEQPALRARAVTCVNLGFRRIARNFEKTHWIYLPEERFAAYRIGFYSHLCPAAVPAGAQSVYVEIAHWGELSDEDAIENAVADCIALGLIDGADDVAVSLAVPVPDAYVVLDHEHARAQEQGISALRELDVHPVGRYGRWEYGSMEEAVLQGRDAAIAILAR
jgi:protoporphyrinogen oxidase